MNNFFYFLISTFLCISLFSCKKPGASSPVAEAPIPTCEIQEIDSFTYLSSKAKLHYTDAQSDHKTNAHIRMKKDSIIWISINAAGGLEAFRILATKDTVYLLNRLGNQYTIIDYPSLSNEVGVELDFGMLQALLLGNALIPKKKEDYVVKSDTSYCVFTQARGNVAITSKVRTHMRKIEFVEVTDGVNILSISYQNFVPLSNYSFASDHTFGLALKEDPDNKTTTIHIEHNKTEFPEKELNFPFNVPDRFKRVVKVRGN